MSLWRLCLVWRIGVWAPFDEVATLHGISPRPAVLSMRAMTAAQVEGQDCPSLAPLQMVDGGHALEPLPN